LRARQARTRARAIDCARRAGILGRSIGVMIGSLRSEFAPLRAVRQLFGREPVAREEQVASARVVCVASGKGGTGKSVLASNLAVLWASRGERVLLVDFDIGMANAHLLLGMSPTRDLAHVAAGESSAEDALASGPHGVRLLSGGVGRQQLAHPSRKELERLFHALEPLEHRFDRIVLDHGAGLSYTSQALICAASTLLLVSNHEVTALSDGYALYKRVTSLRPELRVGLVLNRVPGQEQADAAWERFRGVSHRFLARSPECAGVVPADEAVGASVERRLPVTLHAPRSPAARAIEGVARWAPLEFARTSRPFFERARQALR